MTLVDHLAELRDRIVKSCSPSSLGVAVGFYFATPAHRHPDRAAARTDQLQFLAPGDAFFIYVKIALVAGIILAMPVILCQVWAFIAPGLTDAGAQDRPAVDPGRARVLRARRRARLRRPAVRDPVPPQLPSRVPRSRSRRRARTSTS